MSTFATQYTLVNDNTLRQRVQVCLTKLARDVLSETSSPPSYVVTDPRTIMASSFRNSPWSVQVEPFMWELAFTPSVTSTYGNDAEVPDSDLESVCASVWDSVASRMYPV